MLKFVKRKKKGEVLQKSIKNVAEINQYVLARYCILLAREFLKFSKDSLVF